MALAAGVLGLGVAAGSAYASVTVEGASMVPTLRPGSSVHVLRLPLGLTPGVHRGSLVVFPSPQDGRPSVKRVVGLAGDRVELRDGVLVVDGRVVPEPYVDHATTVGTWFGPLVVPEGTVFVLGDARLHSVDSVDYGPVRRDALLGRVLR